MSSVLESVVSQIEANRKTRRDAFQGLAVGLLDGGSPDAATVEAVVTAAGQTLDDLTAEVERLRQRRALLATILAGQNLEAAEQAALAAMRAADAELAAAHARHKSACNEPLNVLETIGQTRLSAQLAKTKLVRTSNPESLAEVLRIGRVVADFDEQIRELHLAVDHANLIAGKCTGIEPLASTPAIEALQSRRAAALAELHAAEKLLEIA